MEEWMILVVDDEEEADRAALESKCFSYRQPLAKGWETGLDGSVTNMARCRR